jgi:hypothetical protein
LGTARSSSSSHSTTHGETGRSLLNPDEILNLGRDVAIAIQPNGHPHYVRPVDYWNLPKAFGYLQEEHPSLYWEPPLIFDENPYVEPPPPPPPPRGLICGPHVYPRKSNRSCRAFRMLVFLAFRVNSSRASTNNRGQLLGI